MANFAGEERSSRSVCRDEREAVAEILRGERHDAAGGSDFIARECCRQGHRTGEGRGGFGRSRGMDPGGNMCEIGENFIRQLPQGHITDEGDGGEQKADLKGGFHGAVRLERRHDATHVLGPCLQNRENY